MLFFNHPQGKCEVCDGLGFTKKINLTYLVDFNQSLNEDPIDFPTFGNGAWRWKRYALMLDLRTDFLLPCKLIA